MSETVWEDDPELEPHYLFRYKRVEERVEVEDIERTAAGRPIHTVAIERAQTTFPPPERVDYVTIHRSASGALVPSRETIFQFNAEAYPTIHPADVPLEQALRDFMQLAFPEDGEPAFWRGRKGLNQAIATLHHAYRRHGRRTTET